MQHITSLQVLCLRKCPRLTLEDFNLSSLISLETLVIRNCLELDLVKGRKKREEDVSKKNRCLQSLRFGGLADKKNVKAKEDAKEGVRAEKPEEEEDEEEIFQEGLQRLRSLVIEGLPRLNTLPKCFQNALGSLQYLSIVACKNLFLLPDWLGGFTSLRKLKIMNCSDLSTLPKGMLHLTTLQILRLHGCPELTLQEFNLNSLTALEILEIRNCKKLRLVKIKEKQDSKSALIMEDKEELEVKEDEEEEEEDEEEEISQRGLVKLQSLIIENLPLLRTLPRVLQNAANSLQRLSIIACRRFHRLPDWLGNFTSLQRLELLRCPMLLTIPQEIDELHVQQQLRIDWR